MEYPESGNATAVEVTGDRLISACAESKDVVDHIAASFTSFAALQQSNGALFKFLRGKVFRSRAAHVLWIG